MRDRKDGLYDSDKVLVTVALWIAMVATFVTALTLPMLPNKVSMFYRPANGVEAEQYSKYNNLFIIFASVIPALIVIIAASLRRRHRLQNNFLSIILFSIALSIFMSSMICYGITEQFDSSSNIKDINVHGQISVFALFVLSIAASVTPMLLHRGRGAKLLASGAGKGGNILRAAERYWGVGAFGALVAAIVCAFMPAYYCYIPFAIAVAAYALVVVFARPSRDTENVT